MLYEYKCRTHGVFEVNQPITAEHKADCPDCGKPAQRVFTTLAWKWAGAAYRPDGSLRQDKDYAPVMK
jgi:putative FmdB family regulatory protein